MRYRYTIKVEVCPYDVFLSIYTFIAHGRVNVEEFFTSLTKESYFEDKMNNIHKTLESIIVGNTPT